MIFKILIPIILFGCIVCCRSNKEGQYTEKTINKDSTHTGITSLYEVAGDDEQSLCEACISAMYAVKPKMIVGIDHYE